MDLEKRAWNIAPLSDATPDSANLLGPFFSTAEKIHYCKFKIVRGEFTDKDRNNFSTHVAFAGSGTDQQDAETSFHGHADVIWTRSNNQTSNADAALYGLDIENHCSSAVFADFDNYVLQNKPAYNLVPLSDNGKIQIAKLAPTLFGNLEHVPTVSNITRKKKRT